MHKLIVILALVGACKTKTSDNKPPPPAKDEGGDGTAMALDEAKRAGTKPAPAPEAKPAQAPAVVPVAIANDAELEAKLFESYDTANKLLVAGVNRNCDELAADLRKLSEDQKPVMAGIAAYSKAHPDAANAIDKKLEPKTAVFEKTAEPTFTHCKGNKAFLDAVTAPSTSDSP